MNSPTKVNLDNLEETPSSNRSYSTNRIHLQTTSPQTELGNEILNRSPRTGRVIRGDFLFLIYSLSYTL